MICIPAFGHTPLLKSGSRTAASATAIGNVVVEKGASMWYGCVARAERNFIHVGEYSAVQDNVVIHTSPDDPVVIGNRTMVGHASVLHGCTVGDNCSVGMGSILMNRCVIGHHCIIGAGTLVTQGVEIPPYSLVIGSPAKVVRPLNEKELASLENNYQIYINYSCEQLEETP